MWKPHVTVATIVERDGRFLLVEEAPDGVNVLNQPAGHLEPGESLVAAARRETLEETAWDVEPQALVGVYRWIHPQKDLTFVRFAFAGRVLRHAAEQSLDPAVIQAVWLTIDEIRQQRDRHRSPQVLACIEDYLAGQRYPLACLHDITNA